MKNLSKFQLILSAIFLVAIFVGVITLALSRSNSANNTLPKVTIWGIFTEEQFREINSAGSNETRINANYVYKNPATMYGQYLEAVASGNSPDLLIISQADLYKYKGKTVTIPYASYSERTFRDSFIEGTEVLLAPEGVEAFPVATDPLVMYWNRDILNTAGFLRPPIYWDEMYIFSEKVTVKDNDLNIIKSAVALGEYNNINHAKDILSALIYQSGGRVVFRNGGKLESGLNYSFGKPLNPTFASLNFMFQFSDPKKSTYSWNKGLRDSKTMFISGDLALYFGYASEISEIQSKNPNLNFDVSLLPQERGGGVPTTYGKYIVITPLATSPRLAAAYSVLGVLTDSTTSALIPSTGYMPVRRDILSVRQEKAHTSVFFNSAIQTRSWIDPDSTKTNLIFSELINYVISGRMGIYDSINRAARQISDLLK